MSVIKENAINDVTQKLYHLAKVCGMSDDDVFEWVHQIESDIQEKTGYSKLDD